MSRIGVRLSHAGWRASEPRTQRGFASGVSGPGELFRAAYSAKPPCAARTTSVRGSDDPIHMTLQRLPTALGLLVVAVAFASPADACNLPVFRYALERWNKRDAGELYSLYVFNDGAFSDVTEKATKADSTLVLEHGKPLIFGKNRDRGIRLRDYQPEVVTLGDGITEADILVYDEKNPAMAYLIARLGPPRFPTPIGVFTAVERPCYEEGAAAQVAAAKAKTPPDLAGLFDRGDTWTVS